MQSWIEKLAAKPQRSILLLSLALLLAGNWILPLTDRDEARFAEASREMLQRDDVVVPWFNGAWRFDKPVLIYWCQSASYRVFAYLRERLEQMKSDGVSFEKGVPEVIGDLQCPVR